MMVTMKSKFSLGGLLGALLLAVSMSSSDIIVVVHGANVSGVAPFSSVGVVVTAPEVSSSVSPVVSEAAGEDQGGAKPDHHTSMQERALQLPPGPPRPTSSPTSSPSTSPSTSRPSTSSPSTSRPASTSRPSTSRPSLPPSQKASKSSKSKASKSKQKIKSVFDPKAAKSDGSKAAKIAKKSTKAKGATAAGTSTTRPAGGRGVRANVVNAGGSPAAAEMTERSRGGAITPGEDEAVTVVSTNEEDEEMDTTIVDGSGGQQGAIGE